MSTQGSGANTRDQGIPHQPFVQIEEYANVNTQGRGRGRGRGGRGGRDQSTATFQTQGINLVGEMNKAFQATIPQMLQQNKEEILKAAEENTLHLLQNMYPNESEGVSVSIHNPSINNNPNANPNPELYVNQNSGAGRNVRTKNF